MAYIEHVELLRRAKASPPDNPCPIVTAFSGWVFSLYMRTSSQAMKFGSKVERQVEGQRDGIYHPPRGFEREFFDPLDGSAAALRISSLVLNGRPFHGVPDLVFRHKRSGEIVIVERKATSSAPNDWPNLMVQLWCYSRIDRWKGAPKIHLVGSIYEPAKYDLNHSTCAGPWLKGDTTFENQCAELFKAYGGKIV